jgi:phosphoglucosamine mutase
MTRKLFGTDGIRGTANQGNMTPEIALRVGMAAARQFTMGEHRHRVVIGKDTRLSGYMLEPAMMSGFVSMGMDVILVGPMPTPAVAMLTRSLRADLGVMLSASHNPFEDNGIKLFGPDGYKLSDAVETEIEAHVANGISDHLVSPDKLGRAKRLDDARGRYTEYVKQTFPKGLRLDGLKIVVDCANGAAYKVAPEVLWELGADVIPIGVDPDGYNINRGCGSTDTDYMRSQVIAHHAHIGLALDGDADRILVSDEKGELVDGDQIMALITKNLLDRDELIGGGIVATVMSNLGLENYLRSIDLDLIRTQVGDRYVVERMRRDGYNVGGEQSGHVVLGNHSTTGDGLIAALQVLAVIVTEGRPASEVCRLFQPLPQLLKNVRFKSGAPLDSEDVIRSIKEGEERLSTTGRVLIRKSGTEPLIRVMAEGEDEALVLSVVNDIAAAVEQVAG